MIAADASPERLSALVARSGGLQPWRRLFHAGSGLILAWAPAALGLGRPAVVAALAAVVVVLAAGDVVRLRAPRLNALFFSAFPSLASPREAHRPASSTWYAVGALLTWLLFPPAIAVPAILVLALADPAASMLGRLVGRRRLGKGTVEGSLVFLAVAGAVLVATTSSWTAALVVAVGVTLVEVVPWRLDDNLTIPVAAAVLLWMVGF